MGCRSLAEAGRCRTATTCKVSQHSLVLRVIVPWLGKRSTNFWVRGRGCQHSLQEVTFI